LRALFRSLAHILGRPAKRKLAAAAVGSIVIATLDSFAVALVLPLVDVATNSGRNSAPVRITRDVLGTSNPDKLKLILSVALVALFVLKDLGSIWFTWWQSTFINTERVLLSARILEHYLTAPFSEMSRRSAADLMRTMDAAVLQVFTYTIAGLVNFASGAFAVITVIITLLVLSPLPTLAIVAYFTVAAALYLKLVRRKATVAGERLNEASKQGWRTAFAALGAMKEVNLRGSHRYFVDGFRDAQLEGAYAGRTAQVLSLLPKYTLEICFIAAVGLVIGLSSHSPGGSAGALAEVALFVAAGFRTLPAVTTLLSSVSMIRIGADALELVDDEVLRVGLQTTPIAQTAEIVTDQRAAVSDWLQITIDDVSFIYPGASSRVLDGVTLQLPRGTSLALVGPSGAGKTTLVDLILGLHRPQSGRVAVDGIDISCCRDWWRGIVGYVPQDVYVLDATLAENVAFDVPRTAIDGERLAAALSGAQLDSVVGELPDGVNTWLGERGVRLSGGQRQRVGIARALYRRPQLLVLDEATSALDNETEHRVAATMRALTGELTLVVVAHRLSTVRTADQVAFVNVGRIEALGSFEAVSATNEDFARLVKLGAL
jgi:ABC-type multidrug transport system fused ATPase/permease subunit